MTPQDVLDPRTLNELRESVGGDAAFFAELIDEFLADAPRQLQAMRESAAAARPRRLDVRRTRSKGTHGRSARDRSPHSVWRRRLPQLDGDLDAVLARGRGDRRGLDRGARRRSRPSVTPVDSPQSDPRGVFSSAATSSSIRIGLRDVVVHAGLEAGLAVAVHRVRGHGHDPRSSRAVRLGSGASPPARPSPASARP